MCIVGVVQQRQTESNTAAKSKVYKTASRMLHGRPIQRFSKFEITIFLESHITICYKIQVITEILKKKKKCNYGKYTAYKFF
jgi:hypothetical protein